MLLAALASVVIASCYDGDTCTTTTGERVRLACIDTPELVGKRAEPAPAKAARDHLSGQEGWNPTDHRGPLRTNRGRAVPWTDERAARDGRQWSRRDLLEVCRSMSLDRRAVVGSADETSHKQVTQRFPQIP